MLVLKQQKIWMKHDYFFKPASGIRARDEKGKYVGDDKSTPLRNEAYKDGKKPASRKPRKKPAPKKPVAKKAVKKTVKKAPAKKSKPRKTTKKK